MPEDVDGASEEMKEEVKPKRVVRRKKKVTPKDADNITAARSLPSASSKTKLRSRWPGKVVVPEDRTPSGNRYVFEQSGSVVEVASEDVENLLARRRKSGCCGAGQDEPFFELA